MGGLMSEVLEIIATNSDPTEYEGENSEPIINFRTTAKNLLFVEHWELATRLLSTHPPC